MSVPLLAAALLAEAAGPGVDGDRPATCPVCRGLATRHADGSITCHDPDDGPHTMDRDDLRRIAAAQLAVDQLAAGRDRGEVLASLAQRWPVGGSR